MRIPHRIPENTRHAYATSIQTVTLVGERTRQLPSEDFTWDDAVPRSLVDLCVKVLAANFMVHSEVLPFLPDQDFDYLLEILPVTLPIDIVAPIINNSVYWKRCCQNKWPNEPLNIAKHDNCWKTLYIERHVQEYIEYQEPGYVDWDDVRDLMTVCAPFVKRSDIRELKPPREYGPETHPPDLCRRGTVDPDHIDMRPILSKLVNLQELSIRFGVINCGMKYNPDFFRVSLTDLVNLGEGLKTLPVLRSFKLHRSAIDDIRANIIIKALLECPTIKELDMSHCKLGDIAAKSLGKLLLEHKGLTALKIAGNNIREEGALGMAYALQQERCCPLLVLDLEFNLVGDNGAHYLAAAMTKTKTLNELNLSGIGMTFSGAEKIGESLLLNSTLHYIYISNNHLGSTAADILICAAKENRRLLTFDVRCCDLGVEAETEINIRVNRNRVLYRLK